MSTLKVNTVQIGQSGTVADNFVLAVPSPQDGTLKISRGNVGATTQDVMVVDPSGNVTFPAGLEGVLQMVSGDSTIAFANSTATLADTGLSVTITPFSNSSKILVIVSQNIYYLYNTLPASVGLALYRDSTPLYITSSGADISLSPISGGVTGLVSNNFWSYTFLDFPSTLSPVVYKVQARLGTAGSGNMVAGGLNGELSTIIALEIV